jgi:hypothetical protein
MATVTEVRLIILQRLFLEVMNQEYSVYKYWLMVVIIALPPQKAMKKTTVIFYSL